MSAADRSASRLDALLREQRAALREGRLDVLSSVAQRLEPALAACAEGLSMRDAARLQQAAAENARFLRAAMAGLADVRALRQGVHGAPLATYDASGRLTAAAASGQTLARR